MLSVSRLIVGWATLFVIGTDLFVISPLLPFIAGDYRVSVQSAGMAATTFAAGYVIAAPIFGNLADGFGRRRVLTCCLVVFSAANLLTAESGGLPAMLAARLLAGIAAAGVTPSVYALAGISAPAGQRGTWIAIVLTGLLSSLPLGAPLGAMASVRMGWPVVFFTLAAASLVLAPANRLVWAETLPAAAGSAPARLSALSLAGSLAPTVIWATALYSMYIYLGAGLTGLGYDPGAITRIVFVYGAAGFVGALLGGRVADRLGPAAAIRISLTGSCVCFVLLRFALQRATGVWIAFGLTSLMAQIFFPAQQSLLLSTFAQRSSTALSWNNSALFLGIGLGSLVGGRAMGFDGFLAILPLSAAIALAGMAGFSWYNFRMGKPLSA